MTSKKPKQVAEHRWYFYCETANDMIELWSYLTKFINNYDSNKVNSLKKFIGNVNDKIATFVILNAIVNLLEPIHKTQSSLETDQCISHKIYKVLYDINNRFENIELSPNANNLMQSLSLSNKIKVKSVIKEFCD